MGTRRQAREYALQILFQWDVHQTENYWLQEFWAQRPVAQEVRDFTEQLVDGVLAHRLELDRIMEARAANWTVNRMPIVDRNILRMSLFELIWVPDVPAKVSMNEAIELAKVFADDEARRFINGILDKVLKEEPRLEAKRLALAAEGSGREASGSGLETRG